jgi:hypothetical protein
MSAAEGSSWAPAGVAQNNATAKTGAPQRITRFIIVPLGWTDQ